MRATGGKLHLPRIVLAALLVVALCALGGPALAAASEPLEYTLKVTEGETTVPERIVAGTSASASSSRPLVLVLLRAGIPTYQATNKGHPEWSVGFSQVPVPGDVLRLESPAGTPVGAITYDGLPSIDPTVCAGSTNFSGQRSGAETVQGRAFTEAPVLERYGRPIPGQWQRLGEGFAQVTALTGGVFGGNFVSALAGGQTVTARESIETPIAGGAIFTYESETVRPVGACPAPPPPPPPPPAPVIPQLRASLLRVLFPHLRMLSRRGLHDQVSVNQASTVVQDMFLLNSGGLPAHASRSHRRPPAILLARGTASTRRAGTVTVSLHLTPKGRSRMRFGREIGVALVTTVRGVNGVTFTLAPKRLTLHR